MMKRKRGGGSFARTLQRMVLDDVPGMRVATTLSCMRHSGTIRRPGLALFGSRRGGMPLAGRARGW